MPRASRRGWARWATACFGLAIAATLAGCAAPVRLRYHPNLVEQQTLPYGLPECRGRLLNKSWFALCFADEWRIPRWAGHYVTPEDLAEHWPRDQRFFHRDRELPRELQVDTDDYEGSGYDRGHVAPAGDFKRSMPALRATFVMSNMVPQTPQMNRNQWRDLEHGLRARLTSAAGMLVYTGNLFLDERGEPTRPKQHIGSRRVAVPSHCFKVVLFDQADSRVEIFAFVLRNHFAVEQRPLSAYQVSVAEIERLTGLDFFPERRDWGERKATVEPWLDAE